MNFWKKLHLIVSVIVVLLGAVAIAAVFMHREANTLTTREPAEIPAHSVSRTTGL